MCKHRTIPYSEWCALALVAWFFRFFSKFYLRHIS